MKKILFSIITAGLILFATGCEKYLDVNTNPNGPQSVSPFLYLGPMQVQNVESMAWDARMFTHYTQNFAYYTASYRYDQQGDPAWTSDMAQYWRCYYWSMGQNLIDMMTASMEQERWDLVGMGYSLQAWCLQQLIDEHGPVIIKEAFADGQRIFKYDTEEFGYHTVDSLCKQALIYLKRTDGAVSESYAAKGDFVYKGVRSKWIKFTYATLALNKSHLSNKPSMYDAALVMKYVDSSFTSSSDNYLVTFAGTSSSDANFFGPTRDNYRYQVPGRFAVSLLDSSVFKAKDPRMPIMLTVSDNIVNKVAGAQYVGLANGLALTTIASGDRPYCLWGVKDRTKAAPSGTIGSYIFKDATSIPLITYSELQFIKAEAALRSGDRATALTAYTNGVSTSIDFTSGYAGKTTWGETVAVTPAKKTTYLTAVIPVDAADLTMSMIMCQKYIHLWGWGSLETWMDMRRFHYTDTWGTETTQVFAGYVLPTLYSTNEGKTVQRIRPRYNSEYVWNAAALDSIGALSSTYHTKELWAITAD
jgi:hypothetical protein